MKRRYNPNRNRRTGLPLKKSRDWLKKQVVCNYCGDEIETLVYKKAEGPFYHNKACEQLCKLEQSGGPILATSKNYYDIENDTEWRDLSITTTESAEDAVHNLLIEKRNKRHGDKISSPNHYAFSYNHNGNPIYSTTDKDLVIQYFKDDATAFNNLKKSTIEGKGVLNNRISEHILTNLGQIGIKNHLVKRLNMREQIIKFVEIIPIEFIIRNIATGSITKRLGIEDGTVLKQPLLEYCLKDDKLGDPLIAEEHILAFDWATKQELEKVKKMILRINDFMIGMFRGVGIKLIDFKLEFGRLKTNGKTEVILADEISPDTCRLWDSITDKKLDKDRFRKDLGDLIPAYTEVAKRLGILHEQSNVSAVNVTKLSSVKKRK